MEVNKNKRCKIKVGENGMGGREWDGRKRMERKRGKKGVGGEAIA